MNFASATWKCWSGKGFSVNKRLLEKHGTNIDEGILEALRVIKEYLIQVGRISACQNKQKMLESHQKYQAHLDAEDQEKREESKKMEKVKEAETQEKALLEVGAKEDIIQRKIKMADAMIEDGNKILKACLVKMVVSLSKEGP